MKAGVPQASGEIKPEPVFDVEHCGSAIRYMASLPLRVRINNPITGSLSLSMTGLCRRPAWPSIASIPPSGAGVGTPTTP